MASTHYESSDWITEGYSSEDYSGSIRRSECICRLRRSCRAVKQIKSEQRIPWSERVQKRMNTLREHLHTQERNKREVHDICAERYRQSKRRKTNRATYIACDQTFSTEVKTGQKRKACDNQLCSSEDQSHEMVWEEKDRDLGYSSWKTRRPTTVWKQLPDYPEGGPCYNRRRQQAVGHEFHGYMSLPIEIRRHVYKLCLVVGDVFVPSNDEIVRADRQRPPEYIPLVSRYFRDYHGSVRERYTEYLKMIEEGRVSSHKRQAESAQTNFDLLYGVSKQIQAEAEEVFWSHNRIVFPAGPWSYPHWILDMLYDDNSDDDFHIPPAKDLSFAFDFRDDNEENPAPTSKVEYNMKWVALYTAWETEEPDARPSKERIREAYHNLRLSDLRDVWADRCRVISSLDGLHRLQLDFEDCSCHIGCCRQVKWICKRLGSWVSTAQVRPHVQRLV